MIVFCATKVQLVEGWYINRHRVEHKTFSESSCLPPLAVPGYKTSAPRRFRVIKSQAFKTPRDQELKVNSANDPVYPQVNFRQQGVSVLWSQGNSHLLPLWISLQHTDIYLKVSLQSYVHFCVDLFDSGRSAIQFSCFGIHTANFGRFAQGSLDCTSPNFALLSAQNQVLPARHQSAFSLTPHWPWSVYV